MESIPRQGKDGVAAATFGCLPLSTLPSFNTRTPKLVGHMASQNKNYTSQLPSAASVWPCDSVLANIHSGAQCDIQRWPYSRPPSSSFSSFLLAGTWTMRATS